MLERIPCSALPSTLKLMTTASNTYCNYETPMIWSFNSLQLWKWCVSWKLNITAHMLYKSHYGEPVNKFCFTLYTITSQFTFIQPNGIQQMCSLYLTLHTKNMLPARWMAKVTKSVLILSNFYHSPRVTESCYSFIFLYISNVIQQILFK